MDSKSTFWQAYNEAGGDASYEVLKLGKVDPQIVSEVLESGIFLPPSALLAIKEGYSGKLTPIAQQSLEISIEEDSCDWDDFDDEEDWDDDEDDPDLIDYRAQMAREEAEFAERWNDATWDEELVWDNYNPNGPINWDEIPGCNCDNCRRERGETVDDIDLGDYLDDEESSFPES